MNAEKVDASQHGQIGRRPVKQCVSPGHIPEMPTLVPGQLGQWMGDRQADLQDDLANEENVRVLEITSIMARWNRAVDPVDAPARNVTRRARVAGAPGEGRFAPH